MYSYFANVSENNIVLNVIVIDSKYSENGQQYINEELELPGTWIQTDPCSRGGIKYKEDRVTPTNEPHLRFNYSGIGYLYHPELDAFSPPKPELYPSWILDSETVLWVPPIPMPQNGGPWIWNEQLENWEEINISEE